jgi:hypothetical protein
VPFPDEKMLLEAVFMKIRDIKLAHDCPLQTFDYVISHTKSYDNPLLINMSDSPIAKYMNDHKICVLGKGRTFAVRCEIKESTGVESDLSYHYFASLFDRTNTQQIVKKVGDDSMKFNTGSFEFRYTDNIPGQEVFDKIKKIARTLLEDILANFDKYYLLNIDTPYLEVPSDRSGIVTHCIAYYVYLKKNTLFAVTEDTKNHYILRYPNNAPAEMKPFILEGIQNLIEDLA